MLNKESPLNINQEMRQILSSKQTRSVSNVLMTDTSTAKPMLGVWTGFCSPS